jgi:hypothetical protein
MRRVGEDAEYPAIERQHREGGGTDDGAELAEQTTSQEKQDDDRGGVDHQQADVDAPRRVAEQRKDQAVCVVGTRKLHVVGELVWRDALKNQLAGVRVLAFIALEGDAGDAEAHGRDGEHDARDGEGGGMPPDPGNHRAAIMLT